MGKKRKLKEESLNHFDAAPLGSDGTSYEDITGAFFSDALGATRPDNQTPVRVQFVDIDRITPDPVQPRRVVPSTLRGKWDGTPGRTRTLFQAWLQAITEARSSRGEPPFDLDAYLTASATPRAEAAEADAVLPQIGVDAAEEPAPIEAALLRIVALAANIRQNGLANPITVARDDRAEGFIIETGERRWLAYHLLRWHFGDTETAAINGEDVTLDWTKIPARVVDAPDVWRQASENSARADLNAIGKARQLALLLMHLHGPQHFQPIHAFDHEQDFYAQVADGDAYRVPRGKGELLMNALDVPTTQQLRQYRAILRVPRPVWEQADDEDWTENAIDQAIRAPKPAASVVTTTVSDDPTARIDKMKDYYVKRWHKLDPEARQAVKDELRVLLDQLEALEGK